MGDRHVIAFIVDIANRLPVHLEHVARLCRVRRDLGEPVWGNLGLMRRHEVFDRALRSRLEADEDEALPDLMLDWHEAMRLGIELGEGLRLGHGAQRTVEIIGPAVERADDVPVAHLQDAPGLADHLVRGPDGRQQRRLGLSFAGPDGEYAAPPGRG